MMRRYFSAIALGLCLSGGQAFAVDPHTETSNEVISLLRGELPTIRTYLSDAGKAPESSRFMRDQADIQQDLDDLLDEILAAVVGDIYRNKRSEVLARDQRLTVLNTKLADLIEQRDVAKPSPPELSLVDRGLGRKFAPGSREDIDAQIEAVRTELREEEAANRRLFSDLSRELRSQYGIEVSSVQARSLLYQLNGSSLVETRVAYVVLNDIEKRLASSREEAPNDELRRRYYGMAAAMRLVVVRLHEAHLLRYDEEWLPRLAKWEAEQQVLIDQTETLIHEEDASDRRSQLENNLKFQRRSMEVGTDYRDRLLRNQELVRLRLDEARADARVAINTLQTLESVKILSNEIASSTDELRALLEINTSDLIPLTEDDFDDPYLDLSRDLAVS